MFNHAWSLPSSPDTKACSYKALELKWEQNIEDVQHIDPVSNVCLPICMYIYVSVCVLVCFFPRFCMFVFSVCLLFVHQSSHESVFPSVYLSIHLSICDGLFAMFINKEALTLSTLSVSPWNPQTKSVNTPGISTQFCQSIPHYHYTLACQSDTDRKHFWKLGFRSKA